MTVQAEAPSTCTIWPHKIRYATADAASVGLRDWYASRARYAPLPPTISGYPCTGGGVLHHHIGRLPTREERP